MTTSLTTYGTANDYSWTTENIDVCDCLALTSQDVWDWAMQVANNAWDYGFDDDQRAEYGDDFNQFVTESGEVEAIAAHIENFLVSAICE